jgi:methyl-accepting chemotaxis protein
LEEVVQQNAAASHELSSTANDLAAHSSGLQQRVDFFQLDPSGNGYAGPPAPPRGRLAPVVRMPGPTRRLAPPSRRAGPGSVVDGQHGVGQAPPAGQPAPPALPQHPGPASAPPPPTNNLGTPRGGVVVDLDQDDDNFVRQP